MKRELWGIGFAVCAMWMLPVLAGAERTVFSDDFSGAPASGVKSKPIANGWQSTGPELKAYNEAASGMLVVLDETSDEKGAGVNQGFYDGLSRELAGVVLGQDDWVQVSVDLNVFPGSYAGALVANGYDGLRISLTSGGKGYGVNICTGDKTGAWWQGFSKPALSDRKIGKASKRALPSDGTLATLVVRMTPVDGGIQLSGSFAGQPLTEAVVEAPATFSPDLLTFTIGSKDHVLKIDNVVVTAGK